jgi:hypothetical protein
MKNKIENGLAWAAAILLVIAMFGVQHGWNDMITGLLFAAVLWICCAYFTVVESKDEY